eukprot:15438673-Alexandrium_andersonii.AAC.1
MLCEAAADCPNVCRQSRGDFVAFAVRVRTLLGAPTARAGSLSEIMNRQSTPARPGVVSGCRRSEHLAGHSTVWSK